MFPFEQNFVHIIFIFFEYNIIYRIYLKFKDKKKIMMNISGIYIKGPFQMFRTIFKATFKDPVWNIKSTPLL